MKPSTQHESVDRLHPASTWLAKSQNPAWIAFIKFCHELDHGEIESLKIQDGLPLLAEVTKKKVKFVG